MPFRHIPGGIEVGDFLRRANTLKAHVTSEISSPTTDTWTDFSDFTVVGGETVGQIMMLDDNTKFRVQRDGIYLQRVCAFSKQ